MFGGSFSYLYKPIGLSVNISDRLLTWAASAAAVLQAVTRLSFGYLYDKVGFKKLFNILMVINVVNSVICYPARDYPPLYFVCILLNYMVYAGIFAIFPTPAAQTFGPRYGAQVYSIILVAGLVAAIANALHNKILYGMMGLEASYLFNIGGVYSVIGIIINNFFSEKLDIEKMEKKGKIQWKEEI